MKLRRNIKFLSIEKFIEKDNVETEVKGNLGRSSNLKFKMLKTPTRYNATNFQTPYVTWQSCKACTDLTFSHANHHNYSTYGDMHSLFRNCRQTDSAYLVCQSHA